MLLETTDQLPEPGLRRPFFADQRVAEIEEQPADPTQVGNSSQKKMLTFLASSTFWSRVILRPAIFHAPATRRSTSRRAPT